MDVNPRNARQGRKGKPVLAVLLISLALVAVVWVAVEIYGYMLPDKEDSFIEEGQIPPEMEESTPSN